jgi:hypothetical protein
VSQDATKVSRMKREEVEVEESKEKRSPQTQFGCVSRLTAMMSNVNEATAYCWPGVPAPGCWPCAIICCMYHCA